MTLLPPDFDQRLDGAVQHFWQTRSASAGGKQGGARDAVIGGKTMDGFIDLVRAVSAHAGLPADAVRTGRSAVILPGYFRASKNWDALVIHEQVLLGVFEFKSQVGSFGNNFNNRSEEVIGSGADLWVAHRYGAFRGGADDPPLLAAEPGAPLLHPDLQADPRPPFLGWLMLLEECEGSMGPVRCDEPNYKVFPEFRGASYAARYRLLCERLMERRLYTSAALLLTPAHQGATSTYRSLSAATSAKALFSAFAASVLARLADG